MPSRIVTSYEVLAQPIAPVPNVPFVTQGAFLQISNLLNTPTTVSLEYTGTPAFVKSSGTILLFTNFIDQAGMASATSYNVNEFLAAPVGFKALTIPALATWLFGVQYLVNPGSPIPSTGIDARGFLSVNATAGSRLLLAATTRQVFTNFAADGPSGTVTDISESAYPTPLTAAAEYIF